jgi:predicted metal-binding transcription factor (methanogenesis marker protein 9)
MTPYEVLYECPPPIHIPYFSKDLAMNSMDEDEFLSTKKEVIKRVRTHLQDA